MRILIVSFALCLALLHRGREVSAFVSTGTSNGNRHANKLKGESKSSTTTTMTTTTTRTRSRPPTVRPQTTVLHAVAKKKGATAAAAAAAKKSKKTKAVKKEVETIKKSDIVAQMADRCGLTKTDSERALNAFLDVVQDNVADGKKVALVGFGSFTLKDRAARKGRNPQTGEEIDISASKSPGFSAGKNWKDRCNGK